MVAEAPLFATVAKELSTLLDGYLFIAHNARFDHGFLKNEFNRVGIIFRPSVLCNVKLSRALFPEYKHYSGPQKPDNRLRYTLSLKRSENERE